MQANKRAEDPGDKKDSEPHLLPWGGNYNRKASEQDRQGDEGITIL